MEHEFFWRGLSWTLDEFSASSIRSESLEKMGRNRMFSIPKRNVNVVLSDQIYMNVQDDVGDVAKSSNDSNNW